MTDNVMTEVNRVFNKLINEDPALRSLLPSQPSYRYYADRRTKNMYFWTTEKMNRKGKARFVSGVYRYYKTTKTWKPLQQAGHAKRRDAKARAWRLYEKQA